MWWVYIAQCSDGTLYTGIAKDVVRRIKEHNFTKKGAKSLRFKLPVALKYAEEALSVSDALKREREIKGWKREKKLELISLKNVR